MGQLEDVLARIASEIRQRVEPTEADDGPTQTKPVPDVIGRRTIQALEDLVRNVNGMLAGRNGLDIVALEQAQEVLRLHDYHQWEDETLRILNEQMENSPLGKRDRMLVAYAEVTKAAQAALRAHHGPDETCDFCEGSEAQIIRMSYDALWRLGE